MRKILENTKFYRIHNGSIYRGERNNSSFVLPHFNCLVITITRAKKEKGEGAFASGGRWMTIIMARSLGGSFRIKNRETATNYAKCPVVYILCATSRSFMQFDAPARLALRASSGLYYRIGAGILGNFVRMIRRVKSHARRRFSQTIGTLTVRSKLRRWYMAVLLQFRMRWQIFQVEVELDVEFFGVILYW